MFSFFFHYKQLWFDYIKYGLKQFQKLCLHKSDLSPILLVKIIKIGGYELIEAEDSAEALQLILNEKRDILILNVMMPKMTVFEVLKRLSDIEMKKSQY